MVPRSSSPYSLRGFTLVELLVALAVMAVLAVTAGPAFNDFTTKQQVKSAAYDLAQTFQLARSNAILSRRTVDVRASYPNASVGGKWNGLKTSALYSTNVPAADASKIAKSSFYIFETGSALDSTVVGVVNRVTSISTLNSKVIVKADPAMVRFTPDSSVLIALSPLTSVPTNVTSDVTFVVTGTGLVDPGYTVTLNRFGGTQVKKN